MTKKQWLNIEKFLFMAFIFFLPMCIAIKQISYVLKLDQKVNSDDIVSKKCRYHKGLNCNIVYSFNYNNKKYFCTKHYSKWLKVEEPNFGVKSVYFNSKDPHICRVEFWGEDNIEEYICIILLVCIVIIMINKHYKEKLKSSQL